MNKILDFLLYHQIAQVNLVYMRQGFKTTVLGKRKSTEMKTNDHCPVRNNELKKRKNNS